MICWFLFVCLSCTSLCFIKTVLEEHFYTQEATLTLFTIVASCVRTARYVCIQNIIFTNDNTAQWSIKKSDTRLINIWCFMYYWFNMASRFDPESGYCLCGISLHASGLSTFLTHPKNILRSEGWPRVLSAVFSCPTPVVPGIDSIFTPPWAGQSADWRWKNIDFVPLGTGFGAEAFGAVEGLRCSFPLTEVTLQYKSVSNPDAVYTETRRTNYSPTQCAQCTVTPSFILGPKGGFLEDFKNFIWIHGGRLKHIFGTGRHWKNFWNLFIDWLLTSYTLFVSTPL